MNNAEILAVDSSVQTATSAKEKKPFTIFGVEFVHLYLLGIAIALIGWVAENAVKLISSGIIDSRFHLMPFISPYALIPFAFHILLGNPDNLTFFGKKMFQKETTKTKILSNLVSIVMICMFVFLGELVVGNLWEKLFGVQLWNYSTQKFHVTQYVSLLSTLGFGLGAYVIFKFFYRPALKFVQKKVSHKAAVVVCSTLGVAIVLDTICMGLQIAITGAAPVYWTFKVW